MSGLPAEGADGPDFRFTPLTQADREGLVDIAGNQAPGSAFAHATELSLSALGLNLDLHGEWKVRAANGGIPANNLNSWRHVTTSGRDHHVKVVYLGYLFPLGHRATLITITDRVFSPDPVSPSTHAGAYLQYRSFIRVNQRTKTYPAPGQPYGTNAWPFASATMLTEVTPNLDDPSSTFIPPFIAEVGGDYPQAFFPIINGGDYFKFNFHLTDEAGTVISMQMPLVFFFASGAGANVDQYKASDPDMIKIVKAYNNLGQVGGGPANLATSPVAGTHIQYAPTVSHNGVVKTGGTTHPTLALTLGAATPTQVPMPSLTPTPDQTIAPVTTPISHASLVSADQPAFYPSILAAQIRLPAAEALSRSHFDDGTGPGGVSIFLYGPYVSDGFNTAQTPHGIVRGPKTSPIDPSGSTNPGSIFAGLLNQPPLKFPSDSVGGLANPNLGVNGLSGAAGAIGGTLGQYAQNAEALISEYFGGLLDSNFLGGLSLEKILGSFLGDLGVPELSKQVAPDGSVTVTYTLECNLVQDPTQVFTPVGSDPKFKLTGTVKVSLGGTATFDIKGVVDAFTIDILGGSDAVIEIPFGAADTQSGATFTAGSGKKSDVKVNVGQPTFKGALSFVNSLEDFLKDIGGSGVSIDVGPTQIKAAISLSLPSIGCGMFNLENMALSASVVIPFLGGATIATFGFCSQEKPFSLTVMCFGGGGYVLVSLGLTELESLTASLDFEGHFGLDLGVASGGVDAMAGITFNYTAGSGATLTGFVRITGEVEVLGIISVTIELDLSLSYSFSNNSATGTASLKISVSLCFFSISVGFSVTKTFGGSGTGHVIEGHSLDANNDFVTTSKLTFGDQLSNPEWANYCTAFAS